MLREAPPHPRRVAQLGAGLALFGASLALMVLARLGLGPWDVLHEGIVMRTGLPFGWVVNGVAALVLLLWVPLRQRPGVGTVGNVLVVGAALEATLHVVAAPQHLAGRWAFLAAGIALNAVATALYIGARYGPGPRDGLMTGLAARGMSLGAVRTGIELAVLAAGALLGGTVGIGTVLYAACIGPLVHFFMPLLDVGRARPRPPGGHVTRDQEDTPCSVCT